MNVEIVAIGDELLLGEIADSNTQFIARALREAGFELRRAAIVGDNLERIAAAIRDAWDRADAVITTGGLGPTVDDPTREAAAKAAGAELVFHPELWESIRARFKHLGRNPTENNRKQAMLPAGSTALPNPFGTAPGFALEIGRSILFAVPGVPSEMETMISNQVLPALLRRSGAAEAVRKRTIHVAGLGESQIDQRIGRWESMDNPKVGLAAHAGLTDVRIVARAPDAAGAERIAAAAEEEIRAALGEYVVGADEQTLAGSIYRLLPPDGSLASIELGTGGALAGLLAAEDSPKYHGGLVLGKSAAAEKDLAGALDAWRSERKANHAAGLAVEPVEGGFESHYLLLDGENRRERKRKHLVPYGMACRWAANVALTDLRNMLKGSVKE
jgi:nicotinamide-nucleotide amidase